VFFFFFFEHRKGNWQLSEEVRSLNFEQCMCEELRGMQFENSICP